MEKTGNKPRMPPPLPPSNTPTWVSLDTNNRNAVIFERGIIPKEIEHFPTPHFGPQLPSWVYILALSFLSTGLGLAGYCRAGRTFSQGDQPERPWPQVHAFDFLMPAFSIRTWTG